jgi:hypothetical protein
MSSLPVGQLPRVYRQTLRNGISSIIGGAVIPPLLGLHCLVSVKQCVPQEGVCWVAQSVKCLTTDWTAGVRSPTEAEDISSNLCVETGSGAHPASCTTGSGGSFRGGKARSGRDADHSSPSSAEVKKE